MGRLTVEAILYRDYPIVQTNVMLVAATLVTLNLVVDLSVRVARPAHPVLVSR
jgi:peptide/nickel transport system permease protein